MQNDTQFKITYYSNKDKKHITRQGKWTDQCRYWTSKAGDKLMTYFDMDAEGYSCLLYTSPSPRDGLLSRMPSSA